MLFPHTSIWPRGWKQRRVGNIGAMIFFPSHFSIICSSFRVAIAARLCTLSFSNDHCLLLLLLQDLRTLAVRPWSVRSPSSLPYHNSTIRRDVLYSHCQPQQPYLHRRPFCSIKHPQLRCYLEQNSLPPSTMPYLLGPLLRLLFSGQCVPSLCVTRERPYPSLSAINTQSRDTQAEDEKGLQ